MRLRLLDYLRKRAQRTRAVRRFDETAWARIEIPEGMEPETIIREGRDAGFEVDRGRPE